MSQSALISPPAPRHPASGGIAHALLAFAKKNAVFLIALVLAALSMIFVHPDAAYLSYFDWSTLACLFSTLAVVGALGNIRFFTILAEKMVSLAGNLRTCVLCLTYITFLGSMLIANDMALLTFLPLSCFVLLSCKQEKYMALVFILQNAAANLGGMLTPFGNPQNLYLYGYFEIPTGRFLGVMAVPFFAAILLITLLCLFLFPKTPLKVETPTASRLPRTRTALYLFLFLGVILAVFRLFSSYIAAAVVLVALLFLDRRALLKVDYPLLLTFVCFFLFAGNVARIPAFAHFFAQILSWNPLLVSLLSCQVISNVPTAILFSGFTSDWLPLLYGVNIGGVGTLVSSLASWITFRTYLTHNPGQARPYLAKFSLVNFSLLAVLFGVCSLLLLIL